MDGLVPTFIYRAFPRGRLLLEVAFQFHLVSCQNYEYPLVQIFLIADWLIENGKIVMMFTNFAPFVTAMVRYDKRYCTKKL